MKKSLLMLFCAGGLAMVACSKTEKKDTDTAVVTENTTTTSTGDEDEIYRRRADEVTGQMAKDLKFDSDTVIQTKVRTVYYTRAKRRHDLRSKYATDTTGMYAEMRSIDLEADKEFQTILLPEQYKVYETNRTTYYGGFDNTDMMSSENDSSGSNSVSAAGTEGSTMSADAQVKTKTDKDGSSKTQIKDGDSETTIKRDKDGSSKTEIQTKNGETKIKTDKYGHTEIKKNTK